MSKIQTFKKNKKKIIQTYLVLVHQFFILEYQFLSLKWTKNLKLMLIMVHPHPNYNNRVKSLI